MLDEAVLDVNADVRDILGMMVQQHLESHALSESLMRVIDVGIRHLVILEQKQIYIIRDWYGVDDILNFLNLYHRVGQRETVVEVLLVICVPSFVKAEGSRLSQLSRPTSSASAGPEATMVSPSGADPEEATHAVVCPHETGSVNMGSWLQLSKGDLLEGSAITSNQIKQT